MNHPVACAAGWSQYGSSLNIPTSQDPPTLDFFNDTAGITIAAAIRKQLPEVPWSRIRKWLEQGHIFLNGTLIRDEAVRLYVKDQVELRSKSAGSMKSAAYNRLLDTIRIEYIDEHVVVVEKPSGIVTQMLPNTDDEFEAMEYSNTPTLEDMIVTIVKRIVAKNPKMKSGSPRLVHRIDKDTSGLLVFARTGKAFDSLKKQFFEHTIDREYYAYVAGHISRPQTFESYLIRDRGDGKRGSSEEPESHSKHAVTHVEPLESYRYITLIKCILETGRTHQIRIHLSDAGHPLLGDPIYGNGDLSGYVPTPPRLALHAASLGFLHPSGKRLEFSSKIPDDLYKWVSRIEK